MRIVITGATSFIGKSLVRRLSLNGHDCTLIVRPGRSHGGEALPEGHWIEMDMSAYGHMHEYTGDVDCVVNLAWPGTRGRDRMDAAMQEAGYRYTMDVVRSYAKGGCGLIVTAGSQAEYGVRNGVIHETDELIPNTEYGKYKAALFSDAFDICEKRNITLIEPRFFSLYGPGDYEETMIIDILKKMLLNARCDLTLGIQKWDYLYVDDAVEALVLLIEGKGSSGAYNFASGDVRQLRNYIDEMKQITGSRSELNYGAIQYPETGMVSFVADISKLKNTVKWEAKTSFEKGVRTVLASL